MKIAETIVFRRSHTARLLQGPMIVKHERRAMAGHSSEVQGCKDKELMFRDLWPRESRKRRWSDYFVRLLVSSRAPLQRYALWTRRIVLTAEYT